MAMQDSENLLQLIDAMSLTVSTDSLDISFGEISSMYDDGELEIRPAYQRLFRWSIAQQSQFIESLLLGLPIPPIFVIETETRKYELIDGLQRISSYLHFIGVSKGERYGKGHKLKLCECEIVDALNSTTYDDLSPALRIKLKRSYVKMYIIKKESQARIKYDMFKRLNTGGSLLEAQEIRNSTIRFLSEKFINFIQDLSKDDNFKRCISYVQEYLIDRQYDDELVLRFFTLKNANLTLYKSENSSDSLAYFMTKYAEDVASNVNVFDYENEKLIFKHVFKIFNDTLRERSFLDDADNFLAFHYEALTIATASILNERKIKDSNTFKDNLIKLKKDQKFKEATENKKEKRTSGSKYLEYFRKRTEIAKRILSENL